MTIVEFLQARYDDREAALKRVRQPYRLYVCDDGHLSEPLLVDPWDDPPEPGGRYQQWADGDDRLPNHHNSWEQVFDPERELREVEAKRRILDDYERAHGYAQDPCCGRTVDRVIELLAQAYADHPDYDPSWSPT